MSVGFARGSYQRDFSGMLLVGGDLEIEPVGVLDHFEAVEQLAMLVKLLVDGAKDPDVDISTGRIGYLGDEGVYFSAGEVEDFGGDQFVVHDFFFLGMMMCWMARPMNSPTRERPVSHAMNW